VVGVQPFGGEGLSGTGPKAGGPLYMYRLLSTRPEQAVSKAFIKSDGQNAPEKSGRAHLLSPLKSLSDWAHSEKRDVLHTLCKQFEIESQSGLTRVLTGPTGERNTYTILPRARVLCIGDTEEDLFVQLAAVLAVGGKVLWVENPRTKALFGKLPEVVQRAICRVADWNSGAVEFDAVIHHGHSDQLRHLCQLIASRPGAIVSVHGLSSGQCDIPLERLVIERAVSVNTAAAGGNASLMTIG